HLSLVATASSGRQADRRGRPPMVTLMLRLVLFVALFLTSVALTHCGPHREARSPNSDLALAFNAAVTAWELLDLTHEVIIEDEPHPTPEQLAAWEARTLALERAYDALGIASDVLSGKRSDTDAATTLRAAIGLLQRA